MMEAMPRGDIVLVRSKRGEPAVRRVWDDGPQRPYVCHEEYWVRWLRQRLEPVCWQVDRAQVYEYEEALAQQLEEAWAASKHGDASRLGDLWKQARPKWP